MGYIAILSLLFCLTVANTQEAADCSDPTGVLYRGTLAVTINGRTCQKWTSQSPQKHSRTPANYPNSGLGDHNYCRNPDGASTAWCYTTDTSKRFELCAVGYRNPANANCRYEEAVCSDPKGVSYRGTLAKTIGGRTCQKWTSQSPQKHSRTPANYPNSGLGDHNYCRNPDGTSTAWCYTTSIKRWELCAVGVRNPAFPNCNADTCTIPTLPMNLSPSASSSECVAGYELDFGSCSFECASGFYISDSTAITCTTSATLSKPLPTCSRVAEEGVNGGVAEEGVNGDVRLAGEGSFSSGGRVEIFMNGQWGTVCGIDFNTANGNAVCRQLGYPAGLHSYFNQATQFGPGVGPVWLNNVACRPYDWSLEKCLANVRGPTEENACEHNRDAGVICSEPYEGIRLANVGRQGRGGRVEILHDGRWGTICDDNFDAPDADVICRQLGWADGAAGFMTEAKRFGQGSGDIWLKKLKCTGNEAKITDCPSTDPFEVTNCKHSEDVGVVCKGGFRVKTCEDDEIACFAGSKKCVYEEWVCDGDEDCDDGSDERNCARNYDFEENARKQYELEDYDEKDMEMEYKENDGLAEEEEKKEVLSALMDLLLKLENK